MSERKVVLFDADGVLTLPEEFFSEVYAKSRGMDPARFESFFKDQFPAARTGKADLKELIKQNRELWQWHDNVDTLLEMWFESENVRNEPLLKLIKGLRANGNRCYLATNQEKYRGEYMKTRMFPDEFDGYYISAEIGVEKPDPAFFKRIMSDLNIEPDKIIYFDDSPGHVRVAKELGFDAYLYESVNQVRAVCAG